MKIRDFGASRGAKIEHSQSYVRFFATMDGDKRSIFIPKDDHEIAPKSGHRTCR